jgi:hypothetical protein
MRHQLLKTNTVAVIPVVTHTPKGEKVKYLDPFLKASPLLKKNMTYIAF